MMTFADLMSWGRELGVFLGTVLAAFAVSDRISKISIFLIERWRKKKLDSRLRAILIIPNIEELAKYSIQEPQRQEPSATKYSELIRTAQAQDIKMKKLLISQYRVFTIMLTFALTFATIAIRYILTALE